jgi:hypothetical protein
MASNYYTHNQAPVPLTVTIKPDTFLQPPYINTLVSRDDMMRSLERLNIALTQHIDFQSIDQVLRLLMQHTWNLTNYVAGHPVLLMSDKLEHSDQGKQTP